MIFTEGTVFYYYLEWCAYSANVSTLDGFIFWNDTIWSLYTQILLYVFSSMFACIEAII